MQSLKVNSPATSTFVSTATLNGDDAPPQSSASSAEILPLGPMSAPAAAGALKRPFEAIEAHVAAHGTEPRKSPVKRQGSARKIEVVPVSALIQQRDSSAVFPSPTPASVTGTDGLLSMLTEAATAAALPLGDSPDGNESSGSEWGGDRSGAWAPGAQQAVPYRKRIGGHKRAGPGAGPKACFNCDTRKTTAWRRDLDGNLLCGSSRSRLLINDSRADPFFFLSGNPCALYKKYHGVNKPKPLMADQ